MKIVLCLLAVALNGRPPAKATDLEMIRKKYILAVSDKHTCREMLDELGQHAQSNTRLAYLGGFQAIWARHVFNPLSKLQTFYTGKSNIEKAFREDPHNIEIRFVRLSVQQNCPRFLGYRDNIKEDGLFLATNRSRITSSTLTGMVASLLNSRP